MPGNFFNALRTSAMGARQRRAEIAAKLIRDAFHNLMQTQRPKFRHHAAGLQRMRQLGLGRSKNWRGSTPTSLASAFHPRVQVASLAGYPQCHHTRNE